MNTDLLNKIINGYLNSADFNGVPNYELKSFPTKDICELIDNDLVEILSEEEVMNPHIKGFNISTEKTAQKRIVENQNIGFCLYPTIDALKNVVVDTTRPYCALWQVVHLG